MIMINIDPSIKLLALDTSGPALQIALLQNGKIETYIEDIARGHAEILFLRLEKFLAQNELSYQDLTHLAVTTGPGSFTGLRVGIAAARGLALALKIPVIGVPNLFALSLNKKNNCSTGGLSVLIDANRGQYYVQDFIEPGKEKNRPALIENAEAKRKLMVMGQESTDDARVDIKALARWAARASPLDFPPEPTYVRAADAKPQTKAKIARKSASEKDSV